jgi:hypothetical protein
MKYIIKAKQGYVRILNDHADIEFKKLSTEATEFNNKNLAQYFANKLIEGKVEEIK